MGLYEEDFVEQQRMEAIWGRKQKPIQNEIPLGDWQVGANLSFTPDIPCAIEAAFDKWKAEGNKGTFTIMMVYHCPKCTIRRGSL